MELDTMKYADRRRIPDMDSVVRDNEVCDSLISTHDVSFVIASPGHPGNLLYPDDEVSRYRPIEDAAAFGTFDEAGRHLNEVKDKAWWFNIYLGINAYGEPRIEKWDPPPGNAELTVVAMWLAAEDRKRWNNFRLELIGETASPD